MKSKVLGSLKKKNTEIFIKSFNRRQKLSRNKQKIVEELIVLGVTSDYDFKNTYFVNEKL